VIGTFAMTVDGEEVELPMSVQRLVAFLALQDRALLRPHVAGMLWLETPDERAGANLRSALWRLQRNGQRIVDVTSSNLRLAEGVHVDLRERTAAAQRLLAPGAEFIDADMDPALFTSDLLPDWYDDWLVIERERFHQLRLRVLETLCDQLTAAGSYARAVEVGLAAVAGEPLRESAHRALVRVYQAEGNRAEALRQFELYKRLLHDHLGLTPSMQMLELVTE
jgi:DNA-binding SARP family transcriptional activator